MKSFALRNRSHEFINRLKDVTNLNDRVFVVDGSYDFITSLSFLTKARAWLPFSDWRWIVLDGPVDTLWVENLNTALDDSKVLCLASGERINLTPPMRFIFEVDSLAAASPATVSRCAMVYMDPVDLGWRPFVTMWFTRLPK